jgi:drug/metabolite transporter (DMT)-like permease
MTRFALNRGYSSLTVNVYSFGIGSVVCIPFTNFALVAATVAGDPGRMAVILLMHTLFASLIPYMLYTYGMKFMDTGKASILVSVEPVAAALFGLAIYNEIPTAICVAGIVLVLFAIALLNYKPPSSFPERR